MIKIEKSRLKAFALLFAVALLVLAVLNLNPYLEPLELLELKAYDFLMAYVRGPRPAPDDLVVIAIDETSVHELERERRVNLPWPRRIHAELIDALQEEKPAAIVFDVTFFGSSPCPGCPKDEAAPDDRQLATAISRSSAPVILAGALDRTESRTFRQETLLRPLELFLDAGGRVGFATLNGDRLDSVLRRARLSVKGHPTLVTRTLEEVDRNSRWEEAVLGFEGQDPTILINYVGGPRHIPTVAYYQALEPAVYLPNDTFRDKVVLIGRSLAVADLSAGVTEVDIYPSPFTLRQDVSVLMPGVEIHANILHTLLREDFIFRTDPLQNLLLTLGLAGLVGMVVLFLGRLAWKVSVSLGLLAGYGALSVVSFLFFNTWFYTVNPLFAAFLVFGLITLYDYSRSEKERAQIRRALEGYVSPQVMRQVLRNPEALTLGGTQVDATVLFSDISGFSKISEEISAAELAELLNHYFTMMGDVIMSRSGMIDKYIGDAIMAIWGAPLPNPEHPVLACLAALEMKKLTETTEVQTRVGINSGKMVAGNMGHRRRMEYTVIGDAVNVASRLEGANKAFGTEVLVSESTVRRVRDRLLCRPVAAIRVVGRDQPVETFEVIGDRQSADIQPLMERTESFQSIREPYLERRWPQTVQACEAHLKHFPDDRLAQAYLKRCGNYTGQPPADDWDGVWDLATK